MHQDCYLPPDLLHSHLLCGLFESPLLHQLEKERRILAPGVGEDGLAAGLEQVGDQAREGESVPPLVEYVGGEDEVEGSESLRIRRVPVEEGGLRLEIQVRHDVVGCEIEGSLVVVRRGNRGAAREGDDAREPYAAAELDGALAGQVLLRQVPRQGDRARPELGPVREPLVALEVLLIQEGVSRDGVEDTVGPVPDFDEGLEQPGAAAEVGPEFV